MKIKIPVGGGENIVKEVETAEDVFQILKEYGENCTACGLFAGDDSLIMHTILIERRA